MVRSLFLGFLLCACVGASWAQTPIISPAIPTANQGATLNFSCTSTCGTGASWACSGCAGAINSSTGVYTAPTTVTPQSSYGGWQMFPNNHILNTSIAVLSVDSNSATWVSGSGGSALTYIPSFPANYVNNSTPTPSQVYAYTTSNNGPFPFPAYPGYSIESGVLNSINFPAGFGSDHHMDSVNTQTGVFWEIYDPMTAAQCNTYFGMTVNCTALSGLSYNYSDYALATDNSTDAAGMFIRPLSLRLQELEQAYSTCSGSGLTGCGSINHPLRFTLPNGYICDTSTANACGENATGTRHIWPATSEALAGGGTIPYGAWWRLKSTYTISTFSIGAQILLKQLQTYGLILADGGTDWQITIDYTQWSPFWQAALNEVMAASITASNGDFVNAQGLLPGSGNETCPTPKACGLTTNNREEVCYTASTGTTCVDVALSGVAVAMAQDQVNFMAGAPGEQLVAYVNGSSNAGLTWSISPSGTGTLSGSGIYTPPSTISAPTSFTVTATSQANTNIAAQTNLTVFPQTTVRLYSCEAGSPTQGFLGGPQCASNYTDSASHVWYPMVGQVAAAVNTNNFGGTPSGTDVTLYEDPLYSYYGGDTLFSIYVPNGTYAVKSYHMAQRVNASGSTLSLEFPAGTVYQSAVDLYATYGYQALVNFSASATVSNNLLTWADRIYNGAYGNTMSSVSFTQTSSVIGSELSSGVKLASGARLQ